MSEPLRFRVLGLLGLVVLGAHVPAAMSAASFPVALGPVPGPVATHLPSEPLGTRVFFPAAARAALANTIVVEFYPVGMRGEEREGYCWTGSVAVWRPGAWRCTSGNRIYDPCFSLETGAPVVVCGATPFNDGWGFELRLTRPLPPDDPPPRGPHPWIVELADGTRCSAFQGTMPVVEGEAAAYGCGEGWYLLGQPQPGRVWTARRARLSGVPPAAAEIVLVAVRTVWL